MRPKSDNERKRIELKRMRGHDSKLSIFVRQLTPKLDCADGWFVIVPRVTCSFGDLRQILQDSYGVSVPAHACFYNHFSTKPEHRLVSPLGGYIELRPRADHEFVEQCMESVSFIAEGLAEPPP